MFAACSSILLGYYQVLVLVQKTLLGLFFFSLAVVASYVSRLPAAAPAAAAVVLTVTAQSSYDYYYYIYTAIIYVVVVLLRT